MECWNVKKWSKMHKTICYLYIYIYQLTLRLHNAHSMLIVDKMILLCAE